MSAIYKGNFLGYKYEVLGVIKNIGNKTFNSIILYITMYDKNGNLIGIEDTQPIWDISNPGNSSEFKFDVYTNASLFDHYIIKPGSNQK
jgi:hypothetical protein